MTHEESLQRLREAAERIRKDPVKLREFMKSIGAFKKRRILVGKEREQVLTMLRLIESESSNNQHVWTETWHVGNITYHLHDGIGIDELEEVIEDDI